MGMKNQESRRGAPPFSNLSELRVAIEQQRKIIELDEAEIYKSMAGVPMAISNRVRSLMVSRLLMTLGRGVRGLFSRK